MKGSGRAGYTYQKERERDGYNNLLGLEIDYTRHPQNLLVLHSLIRRPFFFLTVR